MVPDWIKKFVHHTYIQRLVAFFSAIQITLLLGIATLWILAVVSDNTVALRWGLWRLVDLALLVNSFGVYIYASSVTRSGPGVITVVLSGLVVMSDLASLIWFGIERRDCQTSFDNGTPISDPLCGVGNFQNVTIYYLVLTSVLGFANLLYGVLIGGLLFLMSIGEVRQGYENRGVRTSVRGAVDLFRSRNRDKKIQYMVTFLLIGWAFILTEVLVLTDYSLFKWTFISHAPHIWPVIQVIVAYNAKKWNFASIWISVGILLASGLGGLLNGILYYIDNCNPVNPPRLGWANLTGCEVGYSGSVYMIVLHSFATAAALVRILTYAHTWNNERGDIASNPRDSTTSLEDAKIMGDADSAVHHRSPYQLLENGDLVLPMKSSLTGHPMVF